MTIHHSTEIGFNLHWKATEEYPKQKKHLPTLDVYNLLLGLFVMTSVAKVHRVGRCARGGASGTAQEPKN